MAGWRSYAAAAWRRMVAGRALGRGIVAAGIVLILFLRDCGPGSGSPEGAARQFITATRAGDKRGAWELLGPRTRGWLQAAAEGATNRVGGTRRFAPMDMLDVSGPEATYAPQSVIVRERARGRAVVDVLGPAGRRDTLELVQVSGEWRVELRTE